jgi:SAM-dependent MidA family methyltransferase
MPPPTSSSPTLPAPSEAAQKVSRALTQRIHAEIAACGGWIDFSRYMELALYAPGLGYYSAGSTKLGAAGDFVTAPELGSALGRALAITLSVELERLSAAHVLELGAGSGALAAQLLDGFAALGLDVQYSILEPSADLKARQEHALERFAGRVTWLDRLPEPPFVGAVVANEVLDALPVTLFEKRDGEVLALGVERSGAGFGWAARGSAEHAAAVAACEQRLGAPLPAGYRSELRPSVPAWLAALARCLARGGVVLIDYGLVEREYYHAQRSAGTLICHYRHRAHGDPFVYPGLQDITAWVDFSACARAAASAGLAVAGFTTQGHYLLNTLAAAPAVLAAPLDPREQSAFKTLVLPGEMGERFKVLLLRKGYDGPALPGRDFSRRLAG